MHQSFGNFGDLDGKSLRALETLVSEVYVGCNGPGCVHMQDESVLGCAHVVKSMET